MADLKDLYPQTMIYDKLVSDTFKVSLGDKAEKMEEAAEKAKEETWIWVEGYKGTDSYMQCNGYQYVMGEMHEMPNEVEIQECRSGFHLCLDITMSLLSLSPTTRICTRELTRLESSMILAWIRESLRSLRKEIER